MAFCSGDQKQVQDKRFDVSHLTSARKITLFWALKHNSTSQSFPLKEKSKCIRAMFKRFHIFVTANGKESCQDDQMQVEGIALLTFFSLLLN